MRLLFELYADVHTVVVAEQRANGLDGRTVAEGRNGFYEVEEFVAVEEQTELVAFQRNVRGHAAQTAEIGHLDFLVFGINGVVARNVATANYSRISVVFLKREGACALLDAYLGKLSVELLVDFARSHCTAGLGQEIFALESAVSAGIVPCAGKLLLGNRSAFANKISQEAAKNRVIEGRRRVVSARRVVAAVRSCARDKGLSYIAD